MGLCYQNCVGGVSRWPQVTREGKERRIDGLKLVEMRRKDKKIVSFHCPGEEKTI